MEKIEKKIEWEGKTGGGNFGQSFLFFIFKLVPPYFIYPLLYFIIPFYLITDKKRIYIYRYFRKNFCFSKLKSLRYTYINYLAFGKIVLDKFAILAGRVNCFRFNIVGHDFLKDLLKEGRGAVIVSAHIGNFEMAGVALKDSKIKINSLIFGEEFEKIKKQRNSVYSDSNIHTISVQKDMSHLFSIKSVLENKEFLTVLCDRNFGSTKKFSVKFLGDDAFLPQGPFRLAAQMDVPVVSLFIMKQNFRKYAIYIARIDEKTQEESVILRAKKLSESFAKEMEFVLNLYPTQWFNYFDFWEK